MIIEMSVLSLEKGIEIEKTVDFKDPSLCTFYRACIIKNCRCENYLAQCEDPSIWDSSLLLFYHRECILSNGLPTAPEILTPH